MAEEELAERQSAKAEELAQMVVLPDSVHPRHSVKKTHKEEFQVDVKHGDDISMEGSLRAKALIQDPTTTNERENNLRTAGDKNQVDPLHMMECQPSDIHSKHKDTRALHTKVDKTSTKSASSLGHIWEGILQLKYRGVTLLALFKSGDKISTKGWPSLLETKGRVKVEEFTRFLRELHLSNAREIMVVHVLLKKGSSENARKCLRETIDDYVAQDRVALLAPVPRVDLYLCPPSWKTVRMLRSFVQEEHAAGLATAPDGFIGLVLRRRELAAPIVSSSSCPSSSSRHRQPTISSGGQSVRKTTTLPRPISDPAAGLQPSFKPDPSVPVPNELGPAKDDEDDNIPPGFGPAVSVDNHPEVEAYVPPPAGPLLLREHQLRELIHKFGHDGNARSVPLAGHFEIPTEPWEDDDDDLPEWQPHLDNFLQPRATSQPSQLHGFQVHHLQPMHYPSNLHPAVSLLPVVFQHPTIGSASFPPQLAPPDHLAMQTISMQGSHGILQSAGTLWRPRAPVDVRSSANKPQLPSHYGGGRPVLEGQRDERRGFGRGPAGS